MSFFSKIISIALIMPIAPVFGMGRILAVLPLPYPLEVLEEKILFIGMERDEAVRKAPERRPLALSEKPLVNYEQQKSAIGYEAGKTFQIPPGLEHRVEFWKKIYGEYSTHQYVIHDTEEMLIYEVIDISDIEQSKISEREQLRRINNRLSEVEEKYHNLLSEIHRKKATNLTPEEKRIYNLFEHLADPDKFFKASHLSRIRAQLGQNDRFKLGIQNCGKYLALIEEVFKKHQLPLELTRIPYIESMFNLEARSFRGASGIWQFMRSTGVRFLTINDVVDERNDPIEATLASAKLLKQNYEKLQSWPLAITAYNHGQTGMFRISQRMNTKDVVKIINEYSSPTFGFASKNFYSEFLAAVEVDKNYEKYFGKLKTQEPAHFDTITLDRYIALTSLSYYTKISKDTYLDLNPGLTAKVSSGIKLLPKGFALRIPKGFEQQFLTRYKNIPRSHFYAQQSRERYHRVRRGDTLSFVAKRYGITVASLMRANRLSQVRFIHIGQVLIIP